MVSGKEKEVIGQLNFCRSWKVGGREEAWTLDRKKEGEMRCMFQVVAENKEGGTIAHWNYYKMSRFPLLTRVSDPV